MVREAMTTALSVASEGLVARMERLIAAHQSDVLAYARRHLPAEVARSISAQDVLQDVYLDAFRRLNQFQPTTPESDRNWLLTIARNRVINICVAHKTQKRGGGRVNVAEAAASDDGMVLLLEDLAIYSRTPSQSAIAHELAARLQVILESLSAEHRRVLHLLYIEGRSVVEAAELMERSAAAIHMLTKRAITALREKFLSEVMIDQPRPAE